MELERQFGGLRWWQSAVIYEIYARSFQDSNADGVGDLNGIAERLDYLAGLGVDAIWITPIYPSPMVDFGYDVADYCGIDPRFGTLDDFDRLLEAAHRRGLRVILDFVPNHTSDRHPWFLESRSSRSNPRRDWYLWRDQPNNWMSHFGGSAWTYDEQTRQYYYHSFLREQPDLNWRNPAVEEAMFAALRFWLRRGVDGFRVDVMWLMIKDDQFRDDPPNPAYAAGQPDIERLLPVYNADRPEVHALVARMRAVVEEFGDRVLIGEIYLPLERLMTYYGAHGKGADLPFNFLLLQSPWTAEAVARTIAEYSAALPPGAWPNWVLGNHDRPRVASRVGRAQAAAAALLLLSLPGTLTLYYGEELGMEDVPIAPDQVRDPAERNEPGRGRGRDPERTPMRWDGSAGAGFTTGEPWLPLGAGRESCNVASEEQDPDSMLALYRRLLALRRERAVLVRGTVRNVAARGSVLSFERADEGTAMLAVFNLGERDEDSEAGRGTIVAATRREREGRVVSGRLRLAPGEGVLIDLH